jgi:hypothetical protein
VNVGLPALVSLIISQELPGDVTMSLNRWQASLIHLGLSAVIYIVLLYLIVFVWYPQPYFGADGGWQGVRLITGVDLVLGPLLTLIVFKAGKPGLKRDLSLIALLQIAALVWGTWIVHGQRTVMVTYAAGNFYAINGEEVRNAGGKAPAIAAQATHPPAYALVRLPTDKKERTRLIMRTILSGRPLQQLGERYEPLDAKTLPEVLAGSQDINGYIKVAQKNRALVDQFLAEHGGTIADYAFFPLYCRYQSLILVLHRRDGSVAGKLDIRPLVFFDRRTQTPASKSSSPGTHS